MMKKWMTSVLANEMTDLIDPYLDAASLMEGMICRVKEA